MKTKLKSLVVFLSAVGFAIIIGGNGGQAFTVGVFTWGIYIMT